MGNCTYTFKGPDGKRVTIKGQEAFKKFLAEGGLAQLQGAARFSPPRQGDLFKGEFATKRSTVKREVVVSSRGAKETVKLGNVASDGSMIAPTIQALDNFWEWYGNGPVDDRGRPILLFHSTNNDVSIFETGRETTNNYGLLGDVTTTRAGIFASSDLDFSQEYLRSGDGQAVMPVFMALQNPIDMREGINGEDLSAVVEASNGALTQRDFYYLDPSKHWELFDDEFGEKFVAAAKAAGFDGAIMVEESPGGESEGGTTYVAFEPTQIKSAVGNIGTFDGSNPDIRFSPSRTPVFFSQLARQFEQAPDRVFGPPAQVKAWLASNAGKLGIKKDEIQWSGINEWLDTKGKNKVSKQDVLAYLEQGGVRVEEVEKGKPAADLWIAEDDDTEYDPADEQQATKYADYVLPGGEDYRELLLTLPGQNPARASLMARAQQVEEAALDEQRDLTEGELALVTAFREQAQALPRSKGPSSPYRSSHWDEKNILAHIRFNARTDAEGNRVLFIEEVQSDWGQDGKKKGFDAAPPASKKPSQEERDVLLREMRNRAKQEIVRRTDGGIDMDTAATVVGSQPMSQVAEWADMVEEWNDLIKREGEWDAYARAGVVPSAPFVTDTKSWVALAIKRMMRYAADNGFQKIAFVNGEQSAERYDLSKKVGAVMYRKNPDGTYDISANGHDGQVLLQEDAASLSRAEDMVGKEVAKKIEAGEGEDGPNGKKILSGLDLKVGGEGMKTFYDKIVPQVASELLKKMGGKLETVSINLDPNSALEFDIRATENGQFALRGRVDRTALFAPYGLYPSREAAQARMQELKSQEDRREQLGFTVPEAAAQPLPLFSPARDLPHAIVANPLGAASKSEDHDLAKAGDLAAGLRLASLLVTPDLVRSLREIASPVVLPVASVEATGRNKIPLAAAAVLAEQLGAEVRVDIVQASAPKRTQLDGLDRLFARPLFDGPVESGRNYILVDDTLTQGGTFAALAEHVVAGGGKVSAIVALTGKQYSRILALSDHNLARVRAKYANVEDQFRAATGYGFDSLTESEARYLANFEPAQTVRDRIAAAGEQARSGNAQADAQQLIQFSPVRRTIDNTIRRLDAAVDGLSNLPDQFDYLKDRYLALGKIARVDEITAEIRDGFSGVPQADKQAVYAYLTTRGASPTMIGNAKARDMAERIKKTINYVGDALVARGLLDPAARAHYKDQYLPRLYLKHVMSDQDWKMIGMGKKPSDMGYLKARKDIPPEVRELVLGEIKDPAYLSANAIGKAMRDVALLDWLGRVGQNGNWVYPDVFVNYKGQRVTAYWLKAEAERIKRQIPHYAAAAQPRAQQLVDGMLQLADQALANLPTVNGQGRVVVEHTKYRQIPDTIRYGLLRGMLVREEIYDDIMGASQIINAEPTWFEDWFGFGGKGTKLTQWWKFSKVALNPPGQVRNFLSNMVMLQLSGVGLHKLPFRFIQAVREISGNGRHWQVAKKYGVTESTFTAQELYRIKRDLIALEAKANSMNPISWLRLAAAHLLDGVSNLYQFSEALGKTIKIIDEMEKGKSEAEAAIEAQKWLFDYSLVPQSVRIARNAPIGMPFLTYQVKVLPRLLEVAMKHPWRFLPWVGLFYGMQSYVAGLFGVDDDELKKLKKSLPEWLQDRAHTVFLPFRDSDGRVQVADVGYFFPWTFYSQFAAHVGEGNLKKALVDDVGGQFSAPMIGAARSLMSNYDTFTKKPIYQESDPVAYQAAAIANYAYDLMAPPFMSSHGFASPMGLVDKQYGGKMVQAMTGTTNKFGDPKATEAQAIAGLLGLNFYGMDPEHTRATNLQVLSKAVQSAEMQLKYRLMDRGLSQEQRDKYISDYRTRMEELAKKAKTYADESEVPPQLRVKK